MTFEAAIERTLGHEAGYVNDPDDPGGETKWGISKRSYPHLNIKELTREQAKDIYRADFWDVLVAHELPDGVAFQALDFAVHSGIGTAIRYLQRAVGVADDGQWGPRSRAALAAMSESDVVLRFVAERLDFMTRLKNWPAHGKGWARRMAQQLRYGAEDTE